MTALAVYRTLLRATSRAFKGDQSTLVRSRKEIRTKFQECSGVNSPERVKQLCAEGREAAEFLQTYVVQGKLNERGNYAVQVEKHHVDTTAEETTLR